MAERTVIVEPRKPIIKAFPVEDVVAGQASDLRCIFNDIQANHTARTSAAMGLLLLCAARLQENEIPCNTRKTPHINVPYRRLRHAGRLQLLLLFRDPFLVRLRFDGLVEPGHPAATPCLRPFRGILRCSARHQEDTSSESVPPIKRPRVRASSPKRRQI